MFFPKNRTEILMLFEKKGTEIANFHTISLIFISIYFDLLIVKIEHLFLHKYYRNRTGSACRFYLQNLFYLTILPEEKTWLFCIIRYKYTPFDRFAMLIGLPAFLFLNITLPCISTNSNVND